MKLSISLTILLLLFSSTLLVQSQQHSSTLQVFHVKPPKPLSWQDTVLQMQAKDEGRLQYLTSLVAGRSVVPIASGRQIIQSPTYIVRAKIGNPPQTLLLAMDTSNDVAWIPCTSCDGCSSTLFAPLGSTTFRNVTCGSPQCYQMKSTLREVDTRELLDENLVKSSNGFQISTSREIDFT